MIDHADRTWRRHVVVYQVYICSFADGNGDGTGDIGGLRSRLPDLRDLGVDAMDHALVPVADGRRRLRRPRSPAHAFNFDYLICSRNARQLAAVIDATMEAHRAVRASPAWVLSNHDVVRHATRYGRDATSAIDARRLYGTRADLDVGPGGPAPRSC